MSLMEIDCIMKDSLTAFYQQLVSGWIGREREMVSYFAFGFLVPRCSPQSAIHDPAQIGMEVAVKQMADTADPKRKNNVCKDLVIWPKPAMNLWNQGQMNANIPLCITEWKCVNPSKRLTAELKLKLKELQGDTEWLSDFTRRNLNVLGYSIFVHQQIKPVVLDCRRFYQGNQEPKRLSLGPVEE